MSENREKTAQDSKLFCFPPDFFAFYYMRESAILVNIPNSSSCGRARKSLKSTCRTRRTCRGRASRPIV